MVSRLANKVMFWCSHFFSSCHGIEFAELTNEQKQAALYVKNYLQLMSNFHGNSEAYKFVKDLLETMMVNTPPTSRLDYVSAIS